MNEIILLINYITPILEKKKQRQLSIIIQALLSMRGRITMLGLSRWSEKGGSYKTIERFFKALRHLPWVCKHLKIGIL
jgi:putative transposase